MYTKRRFLSPQNLVFIGVFFAANFLAAHLGPASAVLPPAGSALRHAAGRPTEVFQGPMSPERGILCGAVVFLIFLHIRLADDIKDAAIDRRLHPERPIASGLLPAAQARRFALLLVALEAALSLAIGGSALAALLPVLVYSWLIYRGFYVKGRLAERIVLNSLVHTAIALPLAFYIATAASGGFPERITRFCLGLALVNWAASLLYDFSRKAYSAEEPGYHGSYAERLGPLRLGVSCLGVAAVMCGIVLWMWRSLFPTCVGLAGFLACAVTLGVGSAAFAGRGGKGFARAVRSGGAALLAAAYFTFLGGVLWKALA
jgi:4-hydroxybenzoate polyprenyltransferase